MATIEAKEMADKLADAIMKASTGGDLIVAKGLLQLSEVLSGAITDVAKMARAANHDSITRDDSLSEQVLSIAKNQELMMKAMRELAEKFLSLDERVARLESRPLVH